MMSSVSEGGMMFCNCGKRAHLRTSWTNDNPDRRFYGCRNWKSGGCDFFAWEDPPMCRRSMTIIPELRWKLAALEVYKKETEKENRKLKFFLAGSWQMFIVFCLGYWIIS